MIFDELEYRAHMYLWVHLAAISKMHLTLNYSVASLFKMLTCSPCMLRFFIGSRLVL